MKGCLACFLQYLVPLTITLFNQCFCPTRYPPGHPYRTFYLRPLSSRHLSICTLLAYRRIGEVASVQLVHSGAQINPLCTPKKE